MPKNHNIFSDLDRLRRQEELVRQIYQNILEFYRVAIFLPQVQKAISAGDDEYRISGDKIVRAYLEKTLKDFNRRMEVAFVNAISEQWEFARLDHWEKLKALYGKDEKVLQQIDGLRKRAEKYHTDRSKEARDYYLQKRNGLSLSDRVWNFSRQMPTEIDIIVQNAIKSGKSARETAGELKYYLNEPDKLFRRVRNPKTGELEWSKAAKDYHTGRGVYRSSYKNAMRLARTETNIAYRYAEWQSFQNNFMIKGFEIRLSNSGNSCPVCEELAGIYPKWFLWTGWHPQCMCHMIPVQISREDLMERFRLRREGRLEEWRPSYYEELPEHFTEYLSNNSVRITSAEKLPYWLEDNWERLKEYLV
ncbi:hypothetical protein ACF3N7_05335 [Cruoricaptor ignavus]|uniref:hypothetical protein n=1 Tax=Cruoricaptor ignavus TaxID=1118202 RepID=UPI00370D52CD